jgi:DNA polymerase-3 subunit delta'
MDKIDFIRNAKKNNRLSHLYLINGFSKSDRLTYVSSAACIILDIEPTAKNIDRIKASENENVFIFNLNEAFLVSSIDQIAKEFSKTSMYNKPRIFIIENVDLLSDTILNKLLKFLEEPVNASTYGFLLTTNKDAVLATILSRSQLINLDNFECEKFASVLVSEYKYPPLKAKIASINKRTIEEANDFVKSREYEQLEATFHKYVEAIASKDDLLICIANQDIFKNKDATLYFLDILTYFYIDILYYQCNLDLFFSEYISEIRIISNYYSKEVINNFIRIISEKKRVLFYWVNLDIQVNDLLMDLDKKEFSW